MTIELAYCAWGLSGYDETILDHVARAHIGWIDIRPGDFVHPAGRRHMYEVGLQESCMGISFALPKDTALDSADLSERMKAVRSCESSILRANAIGIHTAYVVPTQDTSEEALARYALSLTRIADHAQALDVRIAIEHFPHTALPTIAATLAFLREVAHPNLYLLLDIGHAQMTDEYVPAAIGDAGSLLGYVHLDDNDGVGDLHLALLDGVLTPASLRATFDALKEHGYDGRVSLELHPGLEDPVDAMLRSRDAALAAME
jgi:sugar phosphate isomerase/epimerase